MNVNILYHTQKLIYFLFNVAQPTDKIHVYFQKNRLTFEIDLKFSFRVKIIQEELFIEKYTLEYIKKVNGNYQKSDFASTIKIQTIFPINPAIMITNIEDSQNRRIYKVEVGDKNAFIRNRCDYFILYFQNIFLKKITFPVLVNDDGFVINTRLQDKLLEQPVEPVV